MKPMEQIEMTVEPEVIESQPRFDTDAIMEVTSSSRVDVETPAISEVEPEMSFAAPVEGLPISEAEQSQWIWVFEKLKNAEIGLSLSEKIQMFCDVSSPEEVERFIQARLDEQKIIPLAA